MTQCKWPFSSGAIITIASFFTTVINGHNRQGIFNDRYKDIKKQIIHENEAVLQLVKIRMLETITVKSHSFSC